ncbi:unnamed protein product, partial [Nippostrongylus brasiliensis]|uniref:Transposase n=1 Tax=Nippostrongylus brasiliensis TaxID=27835 RepID=A0A0N4YAQ7_NIPBR
MSNWKPVVAGVTDLGETICFGLVAADDGTSSQPIHHVSSLNKFEAEHWDGEHADQLHHPIHQQHVEDEGISLPPPTHDEALGVDDESTPIASSAQFERNRSA